MLWSCVECGMAVRTGLYKAYSKDNIRLTRCVSSSTQGSPTGLGHVAFVYEVG